MTFRDSFKKVDDQIKTALGEDAVFTPSGGQAATIRGYYQEPYLEADIGIGIEDTDPSFTCLKVDLDNAGGVSHGDTLLYDGVTYNVTGIEPDGTGQIKLILTL